MTAVKAGDRVRVTVEDRVSYIYSDGSFQTTNGRFFNPASSDVVEVASSAALCVDDVVMTLEGLAGAVHKTVVVDRDGDAWQYRDGEWVLSGDPDAFPAADYAPFVVVYVPKVKP